MEKNAVIVTRLTYETAAAAFRKVLADLSVHLPQKAEKIAIKINLCDYRMADSGATTDPLLLKTMIQALKEKYSPKKISIIENDATAVEANSLFALLGFRQVAQETSAGLVNVAEGEWVKKPVPNHLFFKEIEVPSVWLEADLAVNFAKLKTNSLTKTTGCLKNMFGMLREKRKSIYHRQIHEVIADINAVMPSQLCLVDGMIGQEGTGPAFGIPKRCELLIAGVDPVAVDACSSRIMGFNPRSVTHLVHCHKRNIGSLDFTLETDIPEFSYDSYKFRYSRIEHMARSAIRKITNIGAAG